MTPENERKVAAFDALMEACQRGGIVTGETTEGVITEHLLDKVVECNRLRAEIARLREALEWTKATHDELLEDGDLILCAVPVVNNASGHSYWDVSLLRVNCDEHFFRLVEVESGDVWGWDWLDVEYWRRVKPPPRAALKEKEGT